MNIYDLIIIKKNNTTLCNYHSKTVTIAGEENVLFNNI
jgi:hypothetical protein